MKKTSALLLVIIVCLMTSCENIERHRIIYGAKKFVKNEYIPRLHDAGSYELANMELLMWVSLADLNIIITELREKQKKTESIQSNLRIKWRELLEQSMEASREMHRYSEYINSIKRRQYYRIKAEKDELEKQIKHLGSKIFEYNMSVIKLDNWLKEAAGNEYVYAWILHEFRAKNQLGGYVKDYNEILYFPLNKKYIFDSCPVHSKKLKLDKI